VKPVARRTLPELFGGSDWRMSLGERAAMEGVLATVKPSISLEIGTLRGGSLVPISAHSDVVHSFDQTFHPDVTQERFPNVVFHEGDSHVLLPEVLAGLADRGMNVDFALVDGDHSVDGVRRDVEDLLASPAVGQSVILIHDTLNERVRTGLREVDFERPKVKHVELDFVTGQIWGGAGFDHDLWGGLGLVVIGLELSRSQRDAAPAYDAADVYATFRRVVTEGRQIEGPAYGEVRVLEDQLNVLRQSLRLMENSVSWRITAPLRRLRRR
jgi:methyltransferase family protein